MLSSVICPALPCFSTLSLTRHDFRKKTVIEHWICVLISSTQFLCSFSHCKKNGTRRYHKVTSVFMSSTRFFYILKKLEFFSADFRKILLKIRPVGAELFHADRRSDRRTDRQAGMTKIIVTFRSCANEPRNLPWWLCLFLCEPGTAFTASIVKIQWIYSTWHDNVWEAPSLFEFTRQQPGTPRLIPDNSNNLAVQYEGEFLTTKSRRTLFDYLSVEISGNISEHNEFQLYLTERRAYKLCNNHLQTKRRPLYLKTQSVPRCKHFPPRL